MHPSLVAERRGEYERSLSYWLRAKKADPDDAGILLGFGRVCLRMDLLDDAEPALEQAGRVALLRPVRVELDEGVPAHARRGLEPEVDAMGGGRRVGRCPAKRFAVIAREIPDLTGDTDGRP